MKSVAVADASTKSPVSANKKHINLSDHSAIKRVLDDAATELILGRGYLENHSLTYWKMAIGLITCIIALLAQFYPKKFPENRNFLIVCIVLYLLFNGLLQLIVHFKEKDHILFTHPFPGSFSSTGLAVSTKLPRYSDSYTIRISSADVKSISAHTPTELSKSVSKWFTKDGVLAQNIFADDIEGALDQFENGSTRKSK